MSKKPNIIYFLWDHHAFYGYGEMAGGPKIIRPNSERIARQGVEFTKAYTACPLCCPARRTMLTGLYPHNHGEIKNGTNHKYDRETYLEKLKDVGYNLFYIGKWHAGRGTAHQFGCEGFNYNGYGNPYLTPEYKDYLKEIDLPPFEVRIKHSFLDPNESYNKTLKIYEGELHMPEFSSLSEHAVGIMTTPKETHEAFFLAHLARKRLEAISISKDPSPFHLRIDFWGPHQPYYVPKEYYDIYNPKAIPELPSFRDDLGNKPNIYRSNHDSKISNNGELIIPNPLDWKIWQEVLACNYAHQTLIDDAMGIILDKIEELGFMENSMIILSSDHGDAVGSYGGNFDKDAYMPETMVHIPFMISFPEIITKGSKSDKLVSNIDLAPTILDAAGTNFSDPIDGISLLSLFKGENPDWREELMVQTHGHYIKHLGRAVLHDRYKYIFNEDDMDELYDLTSDPHELDNLINNPKFDEILKTMKQKLKILRNNANDDITKRMIKGKRLKK